MEKLTDNEKLVIRNCLLAVEKTVHRNPTNNEYYIYSDDFDYKLLADPMIKLLKRLVKSY